MSAVAVIGQYLFSDWVGSISSRCVSPRTLGQRS